jgi:CDP-glucose 4,6-dehydratase
MKPTFWQGKKVFLTGHTGFKGSWLALWLQSMGADVIGYSLPAPTQPSLFNLADVGSRMISITGDVRDLTTLSQALGEHQPEVVIHMAAQSLVRESYHSPVETYTTNVIGTVNMLEAVRHTPSVRVVLNVTTDKCYENQEWHWSYREADRLGGYDPYANSKACAELVTMSYRNSFLANQSVAVATARAGNVIGGGDWAKDRLIPDMMQAFLNNQPVVIRHPNAIRPWQHVLEPLSGYLLLVEKLWEDGQSFAEGWNFGPWIQDAKPVGWIADRLSDAWGSNASWLKDTGQHPHESTILRLDCSKAHSLLGWEPSLPLVNALDWIVEWYKAYEAGEDLRTLTLAQIARYESLRQLDEKALPI